MDALTPLEPHLLRVVLATLVSLGACYWVGLVLVPKGLRGGSKLMRLGLVMASGLLMISSVSSVFALGRLSYVMVIPLAQILWTVTSAWQKKSGIRILETEETEPWTFKEIIWLVSICAGAAILFQLPFLRLFDGGKMLEGHQDHGYFVQQVMSIPEAGVANMWSPVLGSLAAEATGGRDLWYHWGSTFLAIAVAKLSGLPAYHALMDVTGAVMNVILVILAAGIVGSFFRATVSALLLVGMASLMATQMMMVPSVAAWLANRFQDDAILHAKTTLAVYFTYKFEAVVVFGALLAWLGGNRWLSGTLVFCAAVSAPHTVAAGGAAAGVMMIGAVLFKQRVALRFASWVLFCCVGGVLIVRLLGAEVAGGVGQRTVDFGWNDFVHVFREGMGDILWSLILSVVSLPGIVHLIRAKDLAATPQMRTIGWLALSGLVGSCFAAQFLERSFKMLDRYHVMVLTQVIFVMPLGIWGLARMIFIYSDWRRPGAAALMAISVVMGINDLCVPLVRRIPTRWNTIDLDQVRQILKGRTLGYWSRADGGWWFSKHGVLGSMLGSRILRLNPRSEEKESSASLFYGYAAPFKTVPPLVNESTGDWSERFAEKLKVEFVAEIGEDVLPAGVKKKLTPVAEVPGIRLYQWIKD